MTIYKKFDSKKFVDDLQKVDWTDVLTCIDIDLAAEILTSKFKEVLDNHAPWIVFQKRKQFTPWLTE